MNKWIATKKARFCSLVMGSFAALSCGSGLPEQDAEIDVLNDALTTQPLGATVKVTSQWVGGYCANVTVKNTGPNAINGWAATVLPQATLTTSWNAQTTTSRGLLFAKSESYNALLAVGASAQFGYCASSPTPSTPTISSATGQAGNAETGYSAAVRLDSDWGSGYCATVRVNSETSNTLYGWTVVLDLNASSVTSIWDAQSSQAGSKLTATPKSYNTVLAGLSTTSFGFCAQRTGANYHPVLISPRPSTQNILDVAVYLPQRIATCFIGNACTPGTAGCIGLRDDANTLVQGFTDESFVAVRTTSPERAGAEKEVCVEMAIVGEERNDIMTELALTQNDVRQWSLGDIVLNLHVIDFDRLDMDESRWGEGVWIGPWNLTEFARPVLDFVPDFNIVVPPIRDPNLQLHHDLGGCGGTFGADIGIAGAGWSWVPKTKSSFWFDCAEQPVLTHEWLHQVHFAYHNLSGFTDLYGWSMPACGQGDPNRRRWFPDSHQCNEDPDYAQCGLNDCGNNDMVNSHILSEHWDPALHFVANYCEDGIQDFDETGVDTGPTCGATRAVASLAAREPAHATPVPTR
jgi:hypothetical protein